MAGTALTPRVRILAVCDGVRESKTEAGVFDLKGVRHAIQADIFPFVPSRLWLYLLLSNPRAGEYPGYVVINDSTDKTIYYGHLFPKPRFEEDSDLLPVRALIRCTFPKPDRYTVQVWFFQREGFDTVKGELPLDVLQKGD